MLIQRSQLTCKLCRLRTFSTANKRVFTYAAVAAGVTWLFRRAHLAERIKLVFPSYSGASQQAVARAVLQIPNGFCKLAGLHIRAEVAESSEDEKHVMMAVTWLLGQASELKYLHLAFDGLPYLPHLPGIRHLQLCGTESTISRLLPAILSLGTLQTLALRIWKKVCAPPIHLDLQALLQLESVVLDNLVPSSLVLAKGTVLHATVFTLQDAQSSVWASTVASEAMKSFKLVSSSEDIITEEDIPQWLLRPCDLDTLVFTLKTFGDEEYGAIPLEGAFLIAKRVGLLCGESLYVEVPSASYQWELVNFHSEGVLYVHIDKSFPLHCPAFFFRYNHSHGVDLIERACAMRHSGMPFTLARHGDASLLHSPCNNLDMINVHGYYSNTCRCGACAECCRLENFEGVRLPCN